MKAFNSLPFRTDRIRPARVRRITRAAVVQQARKLRTWGVYFLTVRSPVTAISVIWYGCASPSGNGVSSDKNRRKTKTKNSHHLPPFRNGTKKTTGCTLSASTRTYVFLFPFWVQIGYLFSLLFDRHNIFIIITIIIVSLGVARPRRLLVSAEIHHVCENPTYRNY